VITKRILITEDDEDILESMRYVLENEGYQVEGAANGQKALDSLRTAPELPSLILLDMVMPVMDGYQFLVEQGKDERLSQVPVLLMTANDLTPAVRQKFSVEGFLRKPLQLKNLIDSVGQLSAH
jgi:CheY-like chemotaxis protein